MRKIIFLQKIGPVDDSILLKLKKSLKWEFGKYDLNVKVLSYELPLLYKEYNQFKKQYNVDHILNRLKVYAESKKLFRILGVINQDIFSKLVDFRFGCAKYSEDSPYGVALISTFRLKEKMYDRTEDKSLFELRVLKEALHELGHTFGLSINEHCKNHCVMNFSPTVSKIEEKPPFFCEKCTAKLESYFSIVK
jgi:archaemetzincin